MPNTKILAGDCIQTLKQLPDASVNCCVTSPPYFGLRDYDCEGQIGLEETPEEFVAKLVAVFGEVKRVLKDDGTCWINIGDSYASKSLPNNTKHKDLIGIPWMLAFALRADGWYLRQDIIWHKPNPMPEPVKDRCTKAHEYIFLLSKSKNYYYDIDSIRQPWKQNPADIKRALEKHQGYEGKHDKGYNGNVRGQPVGDPNKGATKRSVWSVNTYSYKEAHFATYPPELIKPCILAGCPEGGTVLDPFGGSGTTAQVAMENGRNAVLCELNQDYIKIIEKRLGEIDPLFTQ